MYLIFLMYRSRLQGINRYLLGIRAAALILLIGLLMQPILALTLHTQRLPLIALLIDDSESMQIADGTAARFEIASAVLDHPALQALGDRARVSKFRFSDVLAPMREGEEPTWAGRATDLAGALDGVRAQTMGEGLAAVVLISDGGQNLGGRPRARSRGYRGAGDRHRDRRSGRAQRRGHCIGNYRPLGLCGQAPRRAGARVFLWI